MATDFTVIIGRRQHFGNDEDYLTDVEPGLPFVGPTKDYYFDCRNVDPAESAVLLFQTRDVDHNANIIQINAATAEQPTIFGGLPVSPSKHEWNGNIMLIRPGVLREADNELHIESRSETGGGGDNIDDFVIDNVVVLYKTSADPSAAFLQKLPEHLDRAAIRAKLSAFEPSCGFVFVRMADIMDRLGEPLTDEEESKLRDEFFGLWEFYVKNC